MKRNKKRCDNNTFVKIPGVSGYLIDKKGNVYSEFLGRLLQPFLRSNYMCVRLQKDNGKIKNCLVHRLVATVFISNPYNLPEVDHIDGNIFNNHVDNLRWVTKKDNQNNPISKERRYKAIRQKQGIPIKAFYKGEFVDSFICLMEAAKKLNLHCTLISKQLKGKIDNVKGYTFERILS